MRKLVFLIFGLSLGLFWPGLCNAQKEIKVTATVLESITYVKSENIIEITTNSDSGYWEIKDKDNLIIVSKF